MEQCAFAQKEIAERAGINPSTVSKYLRLNKYPAIDTFANICEILDVSADEILGLKNKKAVVNFADCFLFFVLQRNHAPFVVYFLIP